MRSPDFWRSAPELIGMGLLSGTSMDGIDVALARFYRDDARVPELLVFETIPYSGELRRLLFEISQPERGNTALLGRLHWATGHAFAAAAQEVIARSGIPSAQIRFIGSHGQTVHHFPDAGPVAELPARGTLQIGEPAVIAAKTHIVTVADFRAADLALGGQGAPLVPFFDFAFFVHPTESRVLLNIGGIANFTSLPAAAGAADIIAGDTGPGNLLIDALASRFFGLPFDRGGEIAVRGTVNGELLAGLKQDAYFSAPLPKSTGRETFGETAVERICAEATQRGVSPPDLLATVTRFTADTIAEALQRFLPEQPEAIYLSGGGRHNKALYRMLDAALRPARLRPFDMLGMASDAKEAVCFAYLALAALRRQVVHVPAVTGATEPAILGKICLPPDGVPADHET